MSQNINSQEMVNLQTRQQTANNKLIQFKAEYKSLSQQLSQLWEDAEKEYGVSNIEQLRELYKETVNKQNTSFQEALMKLSEMESVIKEVEDTLAALNTKGV